MKPAILLAILALLPIASATTVVSIDSMDFTTHLYADPFSDTYSMSFAGTLFNPPPITRATISAGVDFGTVSENQVKHWDTYWNITDDSSTSYDIHVASWGEKNWKGTSQRDWIVYLNDTAVYDVTPELIGIWGAHFDYEDGHVFAYQENITAYMPCDGSNPLWSHPEPDLDLSNAYNDWGQTLCQVYVPNGALYFIKPWDIDLAFAADNSSAPHLWLANMTHPAAWDIQVNYGTDVPEEASVYHVVQTEEKKLGDIAADVDSCQYPKIGDFIGFCPTLAGVAGKAVSFLPDVLGSLLDVVNPDWGDFFRLIGTVASEFVSAYFFTLTLIAASPGKLIFVVAISVSGFCNLIGGLRGDLGTIMELHIKSFKVLSIAVFWYFYLYWLMLKFALDTVVKIFNMLAGWAGALLPIP